VCYYYFCIFCTWASHALHHCNIGSFYAYARSHSRGARFRDSKGASPEGMAIHKKQVAWILTLLLNKVSLDASHQYSLVFLFNHYRYDMLECALSYMNCDGIIVASWLFLWNVLNYPFNSCKSLAMTSHSCRVR
jgi:hypothetical protein